MTRWLGLLGAALALEAFRIALLGRVPAQPDFLLGLVVITGLTWRPPAGAVVGFLFGSLRDLIYGTPIGVDALPLALIGWGVGFLGRTVYRDSVLTQGVLIVFSALLHGGVVFLVLRGGAFDGLFGYMGRFVAPSALLTALIVPALHAGYRVWRERRREDALRRALAEDPPPASHRGPGRVVLGP